MGKLCPAPTLPIRTCTVVSWPGAIKAHLRAYFENRSFSGLTYVVIVDGDEVASFRRLPDIVHTPNEHDYRDAARVRPDSAHGASLNAGYLWTDDFMWTPPPAAADTTPPTFAWVSTSRLDSLSAASAGPAGDGIRFVAQVSDASGVRRVVVVYTDGAGVWLPLDLAYDASAGVWTGDAAGAAADLLFMAQAVDQAGNVGVSRGKGVYFTPLAVAAGDDLAADEGAEIAFSGAGPAGAAALWSFGDGQSAAGSYEPRHAYAESGVFRVLLRASDGEGGVGMDALMAVIRNIAPVVQIGAVSTAVPGPVFQGDQITVTASFTAPGLLDLHTAAVDWGDGAAAVARLALRAGGGAITATHSYTEAAVYRLTVCATDDEDETGCDTRAITVYCVAADLVSAFVAASPISLTVRVTNTGQAIAPADVPVTFYAGEPAAGGVLITTTVTSRPLAFGQADELTIGGRPRPRASTSSMRLRMTRALASARRRSAMRITAAARSFCVRGGSTCPSHRMAGAGRSPAAV